MVSSVDQTYWPAEPGSLLSQSPAGHITTQHNYYDVMAMLIIIIIIILLYHHVVSIYLVEG